MVSELELHISPASENLDKVELEGYMLCEILINNPLILFVIQYLCGNNRVLLATPYQTKVPIEEFQ